jgi:hypothetical protein
VKKTPRKKKQKNNHVPFPSRNEKKKTTHGVLRLVDGDFSVPQFSQDHVDGILEGPVDAGQGLDQLFATYGGESEKKESELAKRAAEGKA